MRTRVLSGGIEQSSGKAKQWGQNKRQAQTALALAVSLWIAGGGVAWAAEVNVTNEQEIIISDDHSSDDYIFTQDGVKFTVNNGIVGTIDGADTSGNTITIKNGYAVGQKNKGGNIIAVNGGIANNKVNIESNTMLTPQENIYGGIVYNFDTDACNNEVKVNGGTHRGIYGGYAVNKQANGNRVELSGGSARIVCGGAGRSATNNTVVLHDATITGGVSGGSYSTGDHSGDIKTGNTLILSGVNNVPGAKLYNFETIKFDTSKLTWDTSKTVLTSSYGYADCDKLDVSGIQALTNITQGTMKLLAIGTGQMNPNLITFNPPTTLVYTGTSGTTTATLDSTNPTVTIQSTAKTAGTGGVTIGYNYTHSVVRDDTNKEINYVVANSPVNNITLGTIAWNAGGTVFDGTGYDFATNAVSWNWDNIKDFTFTFANDAAYKSLTPNATMTLISNATGIHGSEIGKDPTFNYTVANGSTLTTKVSGQLFIRPDYPNTLTYKIYNVDINNVNLAGWDSTKDAFAVPDGWRKKNYGNESVTVTAAGFTAPTLGAGESQNIITTNTANFFSDDKITGALKYAEQASSTDTANGVALTGFKSKGVKASTDGKNLVYARSNFNVSNISLGEMTWGEGRALTAGDYDFSAVTNANINTTAFLFSNPDAVTGSGTLLTNATNLVAGTNIAHSQNFTKEVNGATLAATLSGNVTRATAGQIGYTATGTALNGINLTGWNGTTASVPDVWTSALGANSITAAGFTAPTIDAGTSKDILTTKTGSFFNDNQITGALKYAPQASSSDTDK
ncbi:MAG: hypothetical protein K6F95_04840, partial [Selenomonas sp.]|nr:hypothetical protein [Selenomonas sp.]